MPDQTVTLGERNIVHVVNLNNVKEVIKLHIKRLEGGRSLSHFQIESNLKIKDFIDTQLYETFGQKSDEIFLVYTGKQLDINKSFEEEHV